MFVKSQYFLAAIAAAIAFVPSLVHATNGDAAADGSTSVADIPDVTWTHETLYWNSSLKQADGNVLYGLYPDPASGISHEENVKTDYGSLTDGKAWKDGSDFSNYKEAVVALVNQASLTYSFKRCDIAEIRIYAAWGDVGRDDISIASIYAETCYGEKIQISGEKYQVGGSRYYFNYLSLKMADGSPLCKDVVKLIFNFGVQENGRAGYLEVQALKWAAPPWETSSWKNSVFAPAENNLIRGKTPLSYTEFATSDTSAKDVDVLTDGVAEQNVQQKAAIFRSNAVVTYALDGVSVIDEIRIYSTSSDSYRDELAMKSVLVETPSGFVYAISPPQGVRYCDPYNSGTGGCPYASLKMPDGTPLCGNAVKITFDFGTQKKDFVHYSEIEVIGRRVGSTLKLSLTEGAANRYFGDNGVSTVFDFKASFEGESVEEPCYEWDLDGDASFEVMNGRETTQIDLDGCLGSRTVRVRELSTGQMEVIDIGVFLRDVYVAPDSQGANVFPYNTPDKAANDPDSACRLVASGSTIHLLPGVYKHSFSVGPGVRLLAENPAYGATVVTNDLSERVFEVYGEDAIISGLTIAGGGIRKPSEWDGNLPYTQADKFPGGACVYVHDGGTVSNCWISQPNAKDLLRGGAGGCIYSDNGRILDCVIANALLDSIQNHQDIFFGLGIYQKGNTALIDRCIVSNIVIKAPHSNGNFKMGAAIQMTGGTVRNTLVTGCGFYGATYEGNWDTKEQTPGILATGGRIENCTVAGNTSYRTAAGLVVYGPVVVANTIVAGNTINKEGEQKYAYADVFNSKSGTFLSCCTQTSIGNYNAASGNIVADPLFIDAANGKFSLMASSPCRNKAAISEYKGDLDGVDLAHRKRVFGNLLDVGCYEYNGMFMVIVR